MKDTLEIPRDWLERLIEIRDDIDPEADAGPFQYLLGYIDSAETLLQETGEPFLLRDKGDEGWGG